MMQLQGEQLNSFPLQDLIKLADLIYYDGPFLSLFRNHEGKNYLYYWCDSNDICNRWLVFEIDNRTLNSYLSRSQSLHNVIQSATEGSVFSVDIEGDYENHKFLNPRMLSVENIPAEYLPDEESIYEFEPLVVEASTFENLKYRIALDGGWRLSQFFNFSDNYEKVYAFLYSISKIKHESEYLKYIFSSPPFKGGFSYMHFYNNLLNLLPPTDQIRILSIQYASPGWIDLNLLPDVAFSVKNIVTAFVASDNELLNSYRIIYNALKEQDLLTNDTPYNQLPADTREFITESNYGLATLMQLNGVEHINLLTSHDELSTLKILLSLYRRVKKLADYQKSNLAQC
jgi:hypothetical protein